MFIDETNHKTIDLKVKKYESCSRCGQIGHTSEKCPNAIPSIQQMKNEIEKNIQKAIKLAPSDWVEDEYGLYMPSKNPIITETHTWKDGSFCFNCGEFGHTSETCTKPTFEKFEKVLAKQHLKRKSTS